MNSRRQMIKKIRRMIILVPLMVLICTFAVHAADEVIDSHFHIANYAMQGVPLKTLIDRYMGDKVFRSVVFPLPLQQKWDRFEHYAGDKIDDDLTKANMAPGEALPPDATDSSRNTLYNPSLKTIFNFAAEAGLIVNLHSDVHPVRVAYDGKVISMAPEAPRPSKTAPKQSAARIIHINMQRKSRCVRPCAFWIGISHRKPVTNFCRNGKALMSALCS
jgi:hypothetical protein